MDYEDVVKAGTVLTVLVTAVVWAEKVAQHTPAVTEFWEDLKARKAKYDAKVLADATELCYGKAARTDHEIERTIAEFRRELSGWKFPGGRFT